MENNVVSKGVDWQGISDFYSHIKIVWDKIYDAKIKCIISISQDKDSVPVALQIWYDSLIHIYHMIYYTLHETDRSEIDEFISNFEKNTNEQDFYTLLSENPEKANNIKLTCISLNQKIWFLLGKHNFLPKQRILRKYANLEEQIDEENL